VTWKVALDRHQLSTIDKEALQKESGFVDVDQIQEDAWPALMADLTAAKPSIIASAFGMLPFYLPFFPR
jgi:superfamily II DNA/RNA helicase